MGKKKANERAKLPQPAAPATPTAATNGSDHAPQIAAQAVPNGKHAASQERLAALEAQASNLTALLAEKAGALEAASSELAVLRSQKKDQELRLARLAAETEAAKAEAAADRDVAALALASATSAKRVNYVLGAATTLSLAATVVLAFRGRPA